MVRIDDVLRACVPAVQWRRFQALPEDGKARVRAAMQAVPAARAAAAGKAELARLLTPVPPPLTTPPVATEQSAGGIAGGIDGANDGARPKAEANRVSGAKPEAAEASSSQATTEKASSSQEPKAAEVSSSEEPEAPQKRKYKPLVLRPRAPVKPQPLKCTLPGCDWGVDHRPRGFDGVAGNRAAKDKLRAWMNDRRELARYIAGRREVRMKKYAAALRGEVTGDAVFDGKRVPCVALLHGPPGVGKTTLAGLLLASYGFRAHEVNASDVNTGDRLYSELQASVFAPSTGLVLDEFDGMFAGSDDASGARGSSDAKDCGMGRFMAALTSLTVLSGPVVVVANDVTAPHIKALRASPACLDVRLYPVDDRDMVAVLTDVLARHGARLAYTAQSQIVKDSRGDVRMMLHAAQFATRGRVGGVVTAGNDAECDRAFEAAADLLSGKGVLADSCLFSETRLALALAFHNHGAAAARAPPGPDAVAALDAAAARADVLSTADALSDYRHPWLAMEVLDRGFVAHRCANVVNTYASRLKPHEHNVQWPPRHLLARQPVIDVPTWVTHPVTTPAHPSERHPWLACMEGRTCATTAPWHAALAAAGGKAEPQ